MPWAVNRLERKCPRTTPATMDTSITTPASAKEPTTISPRASFGRSSFTHVITSEAFIEGRGMAEKAFRPGEGLGTAVAATAAGVAETPGTGVAVAWGFTGESLEGTRGAT